MQHPNNEAWLKQIKAIQEAGSPFVVYLVNGIKLMFDSLIEFDNECLVATASGNAHSVGTQVVRYNAISTVLPSGRQNPVRKS